jgi:response regulator RpfG family c-di-GMP phosphodiesterase
MPAATDLRVVSQTSPAAGTRAERPWILCVDDEPQILESLRDTLYRRFDVKVATSGPEGLARLGEDPEHFAVVMSDMRMPVMNGGMFLREARLLAPDATRILLTGYADVDAAVHAVNDGQLFRFLTKPCPGEELLASCDSALEQHRLKTAERVLLEQTLRGAVRALAEVLALANPAAFGRSARVRSLVSRLARAIELEESWEVEVAALLVNIGAVTLPPETAEKLYAGTQLTAGEHAMVERVPEVTRRILDNIPRLEGVLEILDNNVRSYGERGAGRSLPLGARILRIALDYDELEGRGTDETVAVAALRGRDQVYDPDLIERFARIVGGDAELDGGKVSQIPLLGLRPGLRLADDVRGSNGSLLIARGHVATDQLITRLWNLAPGSVREPLLVTGRV